MFQKAGISLPRLHSVLTVLDSGRIIAKKRPHRKNPVRPFLGEKETNRKSYPPNRSISWREPAGEHSTVISSVSPIFIPKNTCSCMAFLGSMGCQLCSGESHGSLPRGKQAARLFSCRCTEMLSASMDQTKPRCFAKQNSLRG